MSKNVFEGGSTFDWKSYISYRPDYRLSNFYDLIWDYHLKNGGQWNVAQDVGCGPGNVTEVLAEKFDKVHASDANAYIVEVAKSRLGSDKVTFEVARAEDVTEPQADLITAAECIPLMNQEAAIDAWARLLKPGGTLAIWFYGGPIWPDKEVELQYLMRKIGSRSCDEFRPFKGTPWERIWTVVSSWLDLLHFPEKDWQSVKRMKWNNDRELSFIDMAEYDFEVKYEDMSKNDEVSEKKDRSFWAKQADFAWAKGFVDAQIPRTKDYETDEVKEMFGKMKDEMGSKTYNISWPVVLILATKK